MTQSKRSTSTLFPSTELQAIRKPVDHFPDGTIYKGRGGSPIEWVHAIFETREAAEAASHFLKNHPGDLVDRAPNVNQWDPASYSYTGDEAQYPDGTYFFRIHPAAYSKIAETLTLTPREDLEVYSGEPVPSPTV